MVAPGAQGQGVGREVVRRVAELVKVEQGATDLKTSVGQGEHTPYGFYLGLGFEPTGVYAEEGRGDHGAGAVIELREIDDAVRARS